MNDPVVTLGVGATLPPPVVALVDETGTALDLTGVTSVAVRTRRVGGATTERACLVVTPAQGVVSWEVTAADTSLPGEILCTYLVTYPSGRVLPVPTEGYLRVRVQ